MSRSEKISPARKAAFDILLRVDEGAFASILLASTESELDTADRNLAHELVLGVLRRQSYLDQLIVHFANRDLMRLDPSVVTALRMGLYQLRFLTRIPPSAAVNESVKLVRYARVRSADGFVNAVLRRATREPLFDPLETISDPVERLALQTSHPKWLTEKWIENFGVEFTTQFLGANNSIPLTAFRVVKHKASEDRTITSLRQAGAEISKSELSKTAWRLNGSSVPLLPLVEEGVIYIQDEASQLVGEVVAKNATRRVLDLCAAPGSKTSLIADLSAETVSIVASDVSEPRLRTVVQTARKHGLTNVGYVVVDGLEKLPFAPDTFDTILIDAPCSGTGTLRRNPEIRWRITAADIVELSSRQKRLLANAATVLKTSGTIIYSTCSVEPEENEAVIESFLAASRDFEQVRLAEHGSLKTGDKGRRTWPHLDGSDGFYITMLKRKPIEN